MFVRIIINIRNTHLSLSYSCIQMQMQFSWFGTDPNHFDSFIKIHSIICAQGSFKPLLIKKGFLFTETKESHIMGSNVF